MKYNVRLLELANTIIDAENKIKEIMFEHYGDRINGVQVGYNTVHKRYYVDLFFRNKLSYDEMHSLAESIGLKYTTCVAGNHYRFKVIEEDGY